MKLVAPLSLAFGLTQALTTREVEKQLIFEGPEEWVTAGKGSDSLGTVNLPKYHQIEFDFTYAPGSWGGCLLSLTPSENNSNDWMPFRVPNVCWWDYDPVTSNLQLDQNYGWQWQGNGFQAYYYTKMHIPRGQVMHLSIVQDEEMITYSLDGVTVLQLAYKGNNYRGSDPTKCGTRDDPAFPGQHNTWSSCNFSTFEGDVQAVDGLNVYAGSPNYDGAVDTYGGFITVGNLKIWEL